MAEIKNDWKTMSSKNIIEKFGNYNDNSNNITSPEQLLALNIEDVRKITYSEAKYPFRTSLRRIGKKNYCFL